MEIPSCSSNNQFECNTSNVSAVTPSISSDTLVEGNVFPNLSLLSSSTTNNDELSFDANSEHIILSLLWEKSKLAAAFYNISSAQLYVLPDTIDWSPYFLLTASLYQQINPRKIISINIMSDNFTKFLISLINNKEETVTKELPEKLHLLSRKAHSFNTCKRRVLNTQLDAEPENATEEDRSRYLRTLLDFSNETMIHALGVLLMYIDKYWDFLKNGSILNKPQFCRINTITLNDLVLMNDETYKSLQIFDMFDKDQNFKKGSTVHDKPRLSLFGIFKNCYTSLGQKKMRDIFLHPTNNINAIKDRHSAIMFFMNPHNQDISQGIIESLKNISYLDSVFAKILGLTAKPYHWKVFYKTIRSCVEIKDLLEQHTNICTLFAKIINIDNENKLLLIVNIIDNILDFTADNLNVTIKPGIDLELDKKKEIYAKMESLINKAAEQENKYLPDFIKEYSLNYVNEVGFLLKVKKWKDHLTKEETESLGFPIKFGIENYIFYKSPICSELDNQFGNIRSDITSHEVRILIRLVQIIEKHFLFVKDYLMLMGELDCLLTMSQIAINNDYICPEITDCEKLINIQNGRHPLLELHTSNFVPNNYLSYTNDGIIKIITGPNATGKSVYLKQVALIAFMVHIGSFVPASAVKMSLLDNIHTQMKTSESISSRLSTFLIELRQMAHSIYSATIRSLIVIDEFGTGTTEVDGVALLTACLESFINHNENCPHIILSTHYTQITSILPSSPMIKYHTMDYMLDSNEQIVFLYKLIDGQTDSAQALHILETENLPDEIIDRIKRIRASLTNPQIPFPLPVPQPNLVKRFFEDIQNLEELSEMNLI